MGILSITRLNSRMSQAKGLRSLILPSLPIKTQLKPLGCKVLRRVDWAFGIGVDHDHDVAFLQHSYFGLQKRHLLGEGGVQRAVGEHNPRPRCPDDI